MGTVVLDGSGPWAGPGGGAAVGLQAPASVGGV
jgi:hypothetical protein